MKARRRSLVALALALPLALSPACAKNHGEAFPRAFAEAQRAETAGRYEEASARYESAALTAKVPRDRDHAAFLAGLMLFRAGNVRDGIAKLGPIANADPPTSHSVDAAYRIALARIENRDEARGWQEMETIVWRFPRSGASHRALRLVVVHKGEGPGGKQAALEYLRTLASSPLAESETGEMIEYEMGLVLADLGDNAGAREAFVGVASRWPYPGGAFFDDALTRAAELDEKLGRYAEAVADLERLVNEREVTTLIGSYQRPRMSPALMRAGILYAFRLNDHARARAALHRLYADFVTSTLRDDALFLEAQLVRADGDATGACDLLAALARDFPESRYVPCAMDACPQVKRPERSHSPRECHPYLMKNERWLDGKLD